MTFGDFPLPYGGETSQAAYYEISNVYETDVDWYAVLVVSAPDGITPTITLNSMETTLGPIR
jgi:hypothetical protein